MPIDPMQNIVMGADPNRSGDIADIRRRLAALEHGNPTIQVLTATSPYPLRSPSTTDPKPGSPGPGSGPPPTTPRDGTICFDLPTQKGYIRMSGAWWSWTVTSP